MQHSVDGRSVCGIYSRKMWWPRPWGVIADETGSKAVDIKRRAHLTVRFSRQIEGDQVDDYGHERGEARKEINLPRDKISPRLTSRDSEDKGPLLRKKAPMTTYPNCPPVGLTTSNDTPLEAKSSEELPSGLETHEPGLRDTECEWKDAQ